MKIHEVIYFTHELDMLEAHLEEHQHFVDKFFIKESDCLWSGPSKPLYFDINRKRFSRFNIEHIVIPRTEFNLNIPNIIPEEKFKEYFDIRRHNRTLSRKYRWDDIRKGCDWVMSLDCDEIVDSRKAKIFLDTLTSDVEHVAVKLTQYQFWVNFRGKGLTLWRIFRSDVPHRMAVRGFPRAATPERVGWHFTNCYSPKGLRTKAEGILTHYGYKGINDIPAEEEIARSLKAGKDPFRTRWAGSKMLSSEEHTILPTEDHLEIGLEFAPKFIREHPDLFPIYWNSK